MLTMEYSEHCHVKLFMLIIVVTLRGNAVTHYRVTPLGALLRNSAAAERLGPK